MTLSLRTRAAAILSMLVLAVDCPAETFLVDGYAMRIWRTDDGLPENTVISAVQTDDGYLWFGTNRGLARFNGKRFQVFDPGNTPDLQDPRVTQLFEDAHGTLWIGHESGGITHFQEGRFEAYAVPTGLENEQVIGLGSDPQGELWAMRQNGSIDHLKSGSRHSSMIAPDLPGIMAWTRGTEGEIWVSENGTAARLTGGKLERVTLEDPQRDNYLFGIAASADGGAWMFCDDRIRRWKEGRWVEDLGDNPWSSRSPCHALELRDGTLAVGTIRFGLYLLFRDGRPPVHFDHTNGLPQDWVRFLYEDREGNLWVGAGSAGLVSIHTSPLSVLYSPDRWHGCSVLSVAAGTDDSLWIGTDGDGLHRYSQGAWTEYGEAEGLSNWYIPAVAVSSNGVVWAGTHWWGGPYHLKNDRFVRPSSVDDDSSPVVSLLTIPETDELLVGNREGLLMLGKDHSTPLIRSPEGVADDVCAIARDQNGVIWCGFARGGLVRLADGESTNFRRDDGLGSDSVQCLYLDSDGALWIGTADNGLVRFKDGRFAQIGRDQGLADNIICHILPDDLGHFWLSTHHGIQRVAKSELDRCADGSILTISGQVYDQEDGLPIIEFMGGRQAVGCKSSDGLLWFVSSKAVVSIDPTRIRPNPIPPPVILESLVVDGQAVALPVGVSLSPLPPDHTRLEFGYAGLSFVAPNKVRFKYRLEGFEDDWVYANNERSAVYSRLPSGSYRFRVIACNEDGLWNTLGASIDFKVTPFFWETWWFVSSCLLVAVTIVAGVSRHLTGLRMQREIERVEREHVIDRERARIAQDIHDDLGASLSRIAMLSQPSPRDPPLPDRATTMLSRIYSTASELTRSLDEIVWAVDPRHDTLDSLVDYMVKFAQSFLAAAQMRCRFDLPVEIPTWSLSAEIRHHLFLAFKEALNNVVKHAMATTVHVSVRLLTDAFVIEVRDNGRGFDVTTRARNSSSVDGNGLSNMQARLARIGGRCELVSEAGLGTSIGLVVHMTAPRAHGTSMSTSPESSPRI